MAKEKPYMEFKTKEDFDKEFNKVYSEGEAEGFKKGSIWVLSYVLELFGDMFKPEAFALAESEKRDRNIEQWRKNGIVETLKYQLDKMHF